MAMTRILYIEWFELVLLQRSTQLFMLWVAWQICSLLLDIFFGHKEGAIVIKFFPCFRLHQP